MTALAFGVSLGSKSFRFFPDFGFPVAVLKVNFQSDSDPSEPIQSLLL